MKVRHEKEQRGGNWWTDVKDQKDREERNRSAVSSKISKIGRKWEDEIYKQTLVTLEGSQKEIALLTLL